MFLFACSCWEIQCNGSGCGSCFINGKGWRAVKADSGACGAAVALLGQQVANIAGSEKSTRCYKLFHNDVRTSARDTAGPSQETLQGGDSQEILEGESDFK